MGNTGSKSTNSLDRSINTNVNIDSRTNSDTEISQNVALQDIHDTKWSSNHQVSNAIKELRNKTAQIHSIDYDINSMNELLQLVANRGNKNLQKLYNDELEISTKTSLVNSIDESIEKQKSTISFLIVVFVLVLALVIPLVFMILNKITPTMFCTLVVLDVVIIALLVMWRNNMFHFRSFITSAGMDVETGVEDANSSIQNRVSDFNKIVRADMYGSKSEFENKYCCNPPAPEVEVEFAEDSEMGATHRMPGFYYDDGSAPQQLIVPKNTAKASGEFEDTIQWTDFAADSRDQSLIKGSEMILNEDDRLVGDTTHTRNL